MDLNKLISNSYGARFLHPHATPHTTRTSIHCVVETQSEKLGRGGLEPNENDERESRSNPFSSMPLLWLEQSNIQVPLKFKNIITFSLQKKEFYPMLLRFRPGGGGGGVLGLMFAGYVPLASQSPYPILVYFLANYRPHLSHFLENVIFAIPT